MTDEDYEILELRYRVRNLTEQLALAEGEADRYEKMYLALGEKYTRVKDRLQFLWEEYQILKVQHED